MINYISENTVSPNIFFRVDAGPHHGLGHFSRCYNLAKIFALKYNLKCFFICTKNSKKFFLNKKYNFIKFIYIQSTGFDLDEITFLKKKIKLQKKQILIVDSKNNIKNYLNKVKKYFFLICLDDQKYRNLNCDILINSHIYAKKKYYKNINNRIELIGTKYNLIDEIFFRKEKKNKSIKNIVVSLGGEDPKNCTLLFLKQYYKLLKDRKIHIIIGPAHPNKNSIKNFLKSNNLKFKIYINPKKIYNIFKKSELAISAGGTTLYELAALKIFTIALPVENDQIKIINFLKKKKFVEKIDLKQNNLSKNINVFKRAINDHKYRKKISNNFSKQLSSSGIRLISKKILQFYEK